MSVRKAGLSRAWPVALLAVLLRPQSASAQETRFDAGVEVAASRAGPTTRAGLGVWLDANLSSALAAETHLTWFARRGETGPFHVAAGVRATLARSRRLALYGVALPGIYRARHLRVFVSDDGTPSALREMPRSTRFALQLGAGVMLPQSGPYALRVEFNRFIYALGPREDAVTHQSLGPRELRNGWDVKAGIIRRSGTPLTRRMEGPVRTRWALGSQVGATVATGPIVAGTISAFASYRLSRFCDFDASISTFVRDAIFVGANREGGGIAQGVAGLKLGIRTDRLGVFFKARAGVHSYSQTFNLEGDWSAEDFAPYARTTVPALDIGGVVEAYVSQRLVIRFDVGESLSFFPSVRIDSGVEEPQTGPYVTASVMAPARQFYTVPMRAGVGLRF